MIDLKVQVDFDIICQETRLRTTTVIIHVLICWVQGRFISCHLGGPYCVLWYCARYFARSVRILQCGFCGVRIDLFYDNLPFYPYALEIYRKGETTGSNKANRKLSEGQIEIGARLAKEKRNCSLIRKLQAAFSCLFLNLKQNG